MWQLKIFEGGVPYLFSKISLTSLALALLLSGFILFAAYGKFFSPSEELYILDYSASVFEVVFLAVLLVYRRHIEVWLVASLVFSSWAGYALFWYIVELPCLCMGTAVTIPNGLSLALDAVFYIASFSMLFLLEAPRRWLALSPLSALLFVVSGFAFAQWIYTLILAD